MESLLNRFVNSGNGVKNSANNKKIERRKPNWTECENVFLLDQFSLHRDLLTCKATDASTNLRKQEVWRLICQNLNKHNTLVRRTPAEVRRKWKNLVTAAKKEVWELRHNHHVGHSNNNNNNNNNNSKNISELSQRVLQLHSNVDWSNKLQGGYLTLPPRPPSHLQHLHQLSNDSYEPFTPIVTLSESPPSPCSSTSDDYYDNNHNSRNSGNYYYEGIDLRVNRGGPDGLSEEGPEEEDGGDVAGHHQNFGERTGPRILPGNSDYLRHNKPVSDAELIRTKLELQIDVLRLRKRKLVTELQSENRFKDYVRRYRRALY